MFSLTLKKSPSLFSNDFFLTGILPLFISLNLLTNLLYSLSGSSNDIFPSCISQETIDNKYLLKL